GLRLLQGQIDEAAELLRPFHDRLESAEPLARLHLMAGEYDIAAVVAKHALESAGGDRLQQGMLLGLLVEMEVGRDDLAAAGHYAEALHQVASVAESSVLCAEAALAAGR